MRDAEDMQELDDWYRDEEPPPRPCPECGDDDRHQPDCSRNYRAREYRDEEPPPRACPECGDDDRHQPDCSRNYRAREYRDDDTKQGFCPVCSEPLSALTMAYKGYCETHGWQYADWTPKATA